MFEIRNAIKADKDFWFTVDKHMSEEEFLLKVRDGRGYIICNGVTPIGVMRYNLFWDNTPFLNLLHIEEQHCEKGFGTRAMVFWEGKMRELGYKMVMTSTMVDDGALFFYQKLGYVQKGVITFDETPLKQPPEFILIKNLWS